MSETPSMSMWIGPVLGGVALSIVSTVGNYVVEKKAPQLKAVVRDFILGAILMLLITQILPESTNRLVASILTITTVGTHMIQAGGATLLESDADSTTSNLPTILVAAAPSSTEEYEVRVGVPRF